MQAGGCTCLRPYGSVREGLIGCMSPCSKARAIPPHHLTDLSPFISCNIDSSVTTTGGASSTPRRCPSCSFIWIDQARHRGLRSVDPLGTLVPWYTRQTYLSSSPFSLFFFSKSFDLLRYILLIYGTSASRSTPGLGTAPS